MGVSRFCELGQTDLVTFKNLCEYLNKSMDQGSQDSQTNQQIQ